MRSWMEDSDFIIIVSLDRQGVLLNKDHLAYRKKQIPFSMVTGNV